MPATYQSAVYSSMLDNQTRAYSNAEPPPSSTIIKDPYEVFLSTAPVGRCPNLLTVAKESSAILLLINHHLFIESILDPSDEPPLYPAPIYAILRRSVYLRLTSICRHTTLPAD